MAIIEDIFLGLYSVEMTLKILGMGFIFDDGAYLRDFWGVLDFTIVSSAWVTKVQEWSSASDAANGKNLTESGEPAPEGANLNALRSFRVLRPLRTIT